MFCMFSVSSVVDRRSPLPVPPLTTFDLQPRVVDPITPRCPDFVMAAPHHVSTSPHVIGDLRAWPAALQANRTQPYRDDARPASPRGL